jgi:LysM repeat protein
MLGKVITNDNFVMTLFFNKKLTIMKKIVFFLLFALLTNAQNTTKYEVKSKETLYAISKKFNISIDEIKNANPSITEGLQEGQVILIPVKNDTKIVQKSGNKHKVQPQETLFGIAKAYNVSVFDLEEKNKELLKTGLKTDMLLEIPAKKKTVDGRVRIINEETIFHKVQPKETKFSIAKMYGISIEQLEKQNPEIINSLVSGATLAINKNDIKPQNDSEELMLALAEKEVALEKVKAQKKAMNDLEDQLIVQKQMNQKIMKVNAIKVDLKEIDANKGNSSERLKVIIDANKNFQGVLVSKLDSVVSNMRNDLDDLKKQDIKDIETTRKLLKESYDNQYKTNQLVQQLKKDLAENRDNYIKLMYKVQQINTQQNQELKKKQRIILRSEDVEKEIEENDKVTDQIFTEIDKLGFQKEKEIKRRLSKATFYTATAREYDDKLALQKLSRYKREALEKPDYNLHTELKLTKEEIKEKVATYNSNDFASVRIEVLDSYIQDKEGYYVTINATENAVERDETAKQLVDAGFQNASFIFSLDNFNYYVYTYFYESFEEAVLHIKKNEKLPAYNTVHLVHVKLSN